MSKATQRADDGASLVAWSVEIDDPGELLSWLPAGAGFAFLRGGDGLGGGGGGARVCGWGEAARLPATSVPRSGAELAAATVELLAGMVVRDDVRVPGSG